MLLLEFLNQYKIESGKHEKPTHTSMKGGKWNVPSDKLSQLYKLIESEIINGQETLPLVERIGDILPLIIDIDIKYSDKISERQYTETTILLLINHIWKHIQTYFQVDDYERYGEIFIMEKSKPYPCSSSSYKSKDGIHLLFPHIILEKIAYKPFIDSIKQDEYFMEIFATTCELPPSNTLDTLIDGCFTSWQPYGCSKVNEEYYKVALERLK